jgi:hypothetical protein
MPRQSPYATDFRHFARSVGVQSVDRMTLEVLKDLRKDSEISSPKRPAGERVARSTALRPGGPLADVNWFTFERDLRRAKTSVALPRCPTGRH